MARKSLSEYWQDEYYRHSIVSLLLIFLSFSIILIASYMELFSLVCVGFIILLILFIYVIYNRAEMEYLGSKKLAEKVSLEYLESKPRASDIFTAQGSLRLAHQYGVEKTILLNAIATGCLIILFLLILWISGFMNLDWTYFLAGSLGGLFSASSAKKRMLSKSLSMVENR